MLRRRSAMLLSSAVGLSLASQASAVILYSTGDPSSHTTAPTGDLTNSGWQYQGDVGIFQGVAIGPHAFITAAHVTPGLGSSFVYNGNPYTVTGTNPLANRDL